MLGPLTPAQVPPFVLTAVGGTCLYTWLFNRTGGSVLLAMLTHAAGNAATQWLGALLMRSGIEQPGAGLGSWLIEGGWLNVLAYAAMALALVGLTRGRLGADADEAK